MADAQGRDYSAFQSPVTPGMLAGLSFAYTRVSDWGPDGTTMGTDPTFAQNWAAIKAAGLHRGAYWYLLPNVDPVAQAEYFVAAVQAAGLAAGDMLVCDSEILATNVNEVTYAFCAETAALAGPDCPVLVYSNNNVGQHLTSCTGWGLWFAWPSATAPPTSMISPWKNWMFWQYGVVDGVDADVFNGTPTQLNAWIAAQTEDGEMIMIQPANDQVPEGTTWPGVFLLFCNGSLSHIEATVGGVSNVAAYQAAGIKGPVTITWTEYVTLTTGSAP